MRLETEASGKDAMDSKSKGFEVNGEAAAGMCNIGRMENKGKVAGVKAAGMGNTDKESALAVDVGFVVHAGKEADGNCGNSAEHAEFMIPFGEEWLSSIGMMQYWPQFDEEGYDEWETVITLKDEDLEDMGIKKGGHRRKLLLRIAKVAKYVHVM